MCMCFLDGTCGILYQIPHLYKAYEAFYFMGKDLLCRLQVLFFIGLHCVLTMRFFNL
jgi:hypothetical protein